MSRCRLPVREPLHALRMPNKHLCVCLQQGVLIDAVSTRTASEDVHPKAFPILSYFELFFFCFKLSCFLTEGTSDQCVISVPLPCGHVVQQRRQYLQRSRMHGADVFEVAYRSRALFVFATTPRIDLGTFRLLRGN